MSTYQGTIDWNAVKAAGIDYVFVRAAYRGYETGRIVPDDLFAQNIEGAAAAGLHVGVYLFSQALSEQEALEEADYLLELIDGYPVDYPVVYDQEEYTADQARTDGLTGEQATANALAFCERIYEAGYIPMVYTNNDWAQNMYDMEQLDPLPHLVCGIRGCPVPDRRLCHVAVHRRGHSGRRAGAGRSSTCCSCRQTPEPRTKPAGCKSISGGTPTGGPPLFYVRSCVQFCASMGKFTSSRPDFSHFDKTHNHPQ